MDKVKWAEMLIEVDRALEIGQGHIGDGEIEREVIYNLLRVREMIEKAMGEKREDVNFYSEGYNRMGLGDRNGMEEIIKGWLNGRYDILTSELNELVRYMSGVYGRSEVEMRDEVNRKLNDMGIRIIVGGDRNG